MIRGKKAEERYLSFWMFIVWALIGVGIASGVIIFYSAQVDVREEQADILALRVLDCIVDDGYLNELGADYDIFSACGLRKEMFVRGGDFYFKISLNGKEIIAEGERDFEIQCKLTEAEGTRAEHFAKCSKKRVYAMKENEKVLVEVLAGSNQLGSRL